MLLLTIIALLSVYSLAVFSAGAGCYGWLVRRSPSAFPETLGLAAPATCFALGLGLYSSLWTLVGLAGVFYPWLVWSVLAFSFLVGMRQSLRQMRLLLHKARCAASNLLRLENPLWQALALGAIALAAKGFFTIGRTLTGDSIAFYMAWPKVMAASHILLPLPGYDTFSQIGIHGELHLAALMAMGLGEWSRIFDWIVVLASCPMLAAMGAQAGLGRRGQWISVFMLLTSSAIFACMGSGKTDLFGLLPGLAACYWVWRLDGRPAAILLGLFAGWAIVAKLSYVAPMAVALPLLLIWRVWLYSEQETKQKRRLFLTLCFWSGLAFICALAPHLLKNLMHFNNPFAPLSSNGVGWADQTWFSPSTTKRLLLTYPLALTFGSYWGQFGNISWLVLAFLPLVVMLPKSGPLRRNPLAAYSAAAFLGLASLVALWPSMLSPRYFFPQYFLFCLPAAAGAEAVTRRNGLFLLKAALTWCLGITLYWAWIMYAPSSDIAYPQRTIQTLLTGRVSPEQWRHPFAASMEAANERLAPGSRLMLLTYFRY